MIEMQAPTQLESFTLRRERLGPLPIINHVLQRMDLDRLLERHVPTDDARCAISHARALGALLRSIVVEREPIYRQQETIQGFAPGLFGLDAKEMERLSDDRIGRALDRLFDADRATLLTEVAVSVGEHFDLRFDEFHNDSTSVRFCGRYREANAREIRGKTAPAITYGYSKDHRPDLKQLVLIFTTNKDGDVPIHFRCANGNTSDSRTHLESWDALARLAGRPDFLYVADSKLCSRENMDTIDRAGGRFITVLPRARMEDVEFRKAIQTKTPEWECVWDRPHSRSSDGPRDRWSVYREPLPSCEGWSIVWVWSSLLTLRQEALRRKRIATAVEGLTALRKRLAGAKTRLRSVSQIDQQVAIIFEKSHVRRYVKVRCIPRESYTYKQSRRGRPGAQTVYVKTTKRRYDIEWTIDEDAIAYDHKSDGMYPLITNDRRLSAAQVLEAHKGQPMIEKRFEQLKTVHEIAPVFLKNEGRIEAFFTVYFLALLIQALIEREIRQAMKREQIEELPIYPEQRSCKRPTTEQILGLFSLTERQHLLQNGVSIQCFEAQLTPLQYQVLRLLGLPQSPYRAAPMPG
jgi:transposase